MAPAKKKTTARGSTPARRPRGSLSREEIIAGAFELAARETVDGMSMPRLARHLGVGVTSIYWYFRSREELMDALSAEAAHRFARRIPEFAGLPWDEHLREYFRAHRRIFREEPVLCDLLVMRAGAQSPQTAAGCFGIVEREIAVLVGAGFPVEAALRAYTTLSVYTRGCVVGERLFELAGLETGRLRPPQHLPAAENPLMAEAIEYWTRTFAADTAFEEGLSTIITGLHAQLARHREPEPGTARQVS